MFIEGDIFRVDGNEYRLRLINKHMFCWLEPVLYRDKTTCLTGGLNKMFHMDKLSELEYLDLTY